MSQPMDTRLMQIIHQMIFRFASEDHESSPGKRVAKVLKPTYTTTHHQFHGLSSTHI